MTIRYDRRGWLVRKLYGQRTQVYALPGEVRSRHWFFAAGFCVQAPSLTGALETADTLLKHRDRAMRPRRALCVG